MDLGCCQVLEQEAKEYCRIYGRLPRSPNISEIVACLERLGYRRVSDYRDGDVLISGNHVGRVVGNNWLNYLRGVRVLTPIERVRVDLILRRERG